jgi:hypothetical protein
VTVSILNETLCFAMGSYNLCYIYPVRFILVTGYLYLTPNNTVPNGVPCVPVSFPTYVCQFLVRVPVSCTYSCTSPFMETIRQLHFYLFGYSREDYSSPNRPNLKWALRAPSLGIKFPSCLLDPALWGSVYEVLCLNGLLSDQ